MFLKLHFTVHLCPKKIVEVLEMDNRKVFGVLSMKCWALRNRLLEIIWF